MKKNRKKINNREIFILDEQLTSCLEESTV